MVKQELESQVFRFHDFEVDVAAATLRRGGQRIHLQEQPFQMLVALLEAPGTLVLRQDLCDLLWPQEQYGEFDDRLNTAVLKLRQVLGDSASHPRFIETVPRRGYRFVAPVTRGTTHQREGEEEPEAAGPAQGMHDSTGWKAAWLSIAVAIIAVIAWFAMQREAIPFAERDWVVITELENTTGDEVFDRSLRTALTIGIRQSRYVNVMPDQYINEALQRMGREPGTRITEGVGAEIAMREGARLLMVGSVSRIGEVYELAARLVDPQSLQDVTVVTARAPHRDRVIVALDELVAKVRLRLGESSDMVAAARVTLPKATTSSLEALKLFAEANETLWSSNEHGHAIEALEQAIALDPDFALAHMTLGAWYYAMNDRPRGEAHFGKALSLRDRLTRRERLWLEADVEGWRGNTEAAIAAYRRLLTEYPDASRVWFRLGYQYLKTRQCALAEQAYRRVLELNPSSANAWINIATCQAYQERYDAAIASYEQAFATRDSVRTASALREYATILVLAARPNDAKAVFEEMITAEQTYQRPLGHRGLGFLDLLDGHVTDAIEEFQTAVSLHHDRSDTTAELRTRIFLGWTLRMAGEQARLEHELDLIEQLLATETVSPYFIALAGKLLAREGRWKALSQLLDDVAERTNRGNPLDQASSLLLRGELALATGEYHTAVAALSEAAEGTHREAYFLESLAQALAREGRDDDSLAVYKEILARRWFGYEAQFVWMAAPYQMAVLADERGDTHVAEQYYHRFLDQWPAPDSRLVDVAAARERLRRTP